MSCVLLTSPCSSPVMCSWHARVLRAHRELAEGCEVSESSIQLSEPASSRILLSLLPPLKAELVPGMTAPPATLSHISINICSPGLWRGAAVNQLSQWCWLDLQQVLNH